MVWYGTGGYIGCDVVGGGGWLSLRASLALIRPCGVNPSLVRHLLLSGRFTLVVLLSSLVNERLSADRAWWQCQSVEEEERNGLVGGGEAPWSFG